MRNYWLSLIMELLRLWIFQNWKMHTRLNNFSLFILLIKLIKSLIILINYLFNQ